MRHRRMRALQLPVADGFELAQGRLVNWRAETTPLLSFSRLRFFKTSQAPLYPLGMAAILASYVLAMIIMILYATYCWWENKRRDAVDATSGEVRHADTDFKDLTDKQNIHFRYVW